MSAELITGQLTTLHNRVSQETFAEQANGNQRNGPGISWTRARRLPPKAASHVGAIKHCVFYAVRTIESRPLAWRKPGKLRHRHEPPLHFDCSLLGLTIMRCNTHPIVESVSHERFGDVLKIAPCS